VEEKDDLGGPGRFARGVRSLVDVVDPQPVVRTIASGDLDVVGLEVVAGKRVETLLRCAKHPHLDPPLTGDSNPIDPLQTTPIA
jgi:hypothetical protein